MIDNIGVIFTINLVRTHWLFVQRKVAIHNYSREISLYKGVLTSSNKLLKE